MAKSKKKIKKAAPKSRKVAPKAIKRKEPAAKTVKRALAIKAAKRPAPKKSARPIADTVAEIVTAATRASVDLESAAGRMQRAAIQKVGEVAARATRAMKNAVALFASSFPATTNCRFARARRPVRRGASSATTTKSAPSTC